LHDALPIWGLSYSAGFTLTEPLAALIAKIPAAGWDRADNADRQPRDGAWVVELTHMADLTGWPDGMRLIVRKERLHPGAQLRITDHDGHRLTAFVTNTRGGQLADLELRHRQRARCEDRIRAGKQTGLAGFPLDRKSTRLNSSHVSISYAVFCLKKKK